MSTTMAVHRREGASYVLVSALAWPASVELAALHVLVRETSENRDAALDLRLVDRGEVQPQIGLVRRLGKERGSPREPDASRGRGVVQRGNGDPVRDAHPEHE